MPQTTADPAFDFAHGRLFGDDNQKGRVTATAGKVWVWKVRTVAARGTLRDPSPSTEVGMCSDLVRHIHRMNPIDADQDHTLRRMIGWCGSMASGIAPEQDKAPLLRREGFRRKADIARTSSRPVVTRFC